MNEAMLSAPIPGESLTTEPGNSPWEQPPRMVELDEVVKFYSDFIFTPVSMTKVADIVEQGIPLVQLAETMTQNFVMKGEHSIDVGILALPVLVEMLKAVAEIAGVEYELDAKMTQARQQMLSEKDYFSIIGAKKEAPAPMEEPVAQKPSRGLMSKGE